MLFRKIVGITGISLWLALIVVAVLTGFQTKANGEPLLKNLPEGWLIEESFIVPKDQVLEFSKKLGGRIIRLSNTNLSIEGKPLQINIISCATAGGAKTIHANILKTKGHPAFCLMFDNTIVEFVGDDTNLAKTAGRKLGFTLKHVKYVTGGLIKKVPAGWQLENSFAVPKEQLSVISEKLGGRIKNLSNTIFKVSGKKFQVNIIECPTADSAGKIYDNVLKLKSDPAFVLRLETIVVEFVSDDVELSKQAVDKLGLKEPAVTEKSADEIETIARDLVTLLTEGDFEKATENFDATMKSALPAGQLKQVWDGLNVQAGPFVEQLGAREEKIMGYDVIFVTCKFKNAILDTKVVFDKNKKIAGLFFVPSQTSGTD